MKITLAILALLVFAVSLVADYQWRKWMNRRRAEHPDDRDPRRHPGP